MNLVIDSVPVRQDNAGRYCLNDLHKAAGAERRNDPHDWLRLKQTKEVVDLLSDTGIPVTVVKGGSNQGTFVCRELVYSYAMWISPAFNLKVIRTFDALVSQGSSSNPVVADRIQAGVILLESASKLLNLSNSSKLGAFQKLQQVAGLPNLMPSYAIDAPADAVDGSSRPTQSLSFLLKANGMRMTANSVYHQMVRLGIVERKTRNSRSGVGGVKSFWSLTSKGCLYGKNITSPANPRETQPHFFESKFPELLRLLDNVR